MTMKYIVTATVGGEHLGEALNGLHKHSHTVSVSPDLATVAAINAAASLTTKAKAANVKTAKKIIKVKKGHKRAKRDGSLTEAAKTLIEGFGTPAFELKDLIAHATEKGINRPTVFRALTLEIAAGRLAKIKPGVYQRKGASFAHQFGLSG